MKYFIKVGLFFFISMLFIGCTDKITIEQEKFTIQFGSECGWCAGQEYITITDSKVKYERIIPCGENKKTTTKSRELNSYEREEISSSFDYSLYKSLEYTACNVCADGCDEIIRITKDNTSHELRYSFSDEIEGMENFRQILLELMDEMRKLN